MVVLKLLSRISNLAGVANEDRNGLSGLLLSRAEDGSTAGCALVEYETSGEARKAVEVLEDWKFDKNHSLRVTPHNRARRLQNEVEEELGFASPEPDPCRVKVDTTSWLEDPCQRNQFAIRRGKETSVRWCDGREEPVLEYNESRVRSDVPQFVIVTPMLPLAPGLLTPFPSNFYHARISLLDRKSEIRAW